MDGERLGHGPATAGSGGVELRSTGAETLGEIRVGAAGAGGAALVGVPAGCVVARTTDKDGGAWAPTTGVAVGWAGAGPKLGMRAVGVVGGEAPGLASPAEIDSPIVRARGGGARMTEGRLALGRGDAGGVTGRAVAAARENASG